MLADPLVRDAALVAVAWLAYFVLHSLLASLTVKNWVSHHRPQWMPSYRLGFNVLAVLLLAGPMTVSVLGQGIAIWSFNGWLQWLMWGMALGAVICFFWSLKYYDMSEFMGLRQLREHEERVEDQEHFQLSPLHRFVRHPWYTIALVLIWTRPMNSLTLTSSILMTAYFVIGSRMEERKLMHYYGEVYRAYQSSVPGLMPRPWQYLSTKSAEALLDLSRTMPKKT